MEFLIETDAPCPYPNLFESLKLSWKGTHDAVITNWRFLNRDCEALLKIVNENREFIACFYSENVDESEAFWSDADFKQTKSLSCKESLISAGIKIGNSKDLFYQPKKWMDARPTLFLDRDGVLNQDDGYVFQIDKMIIKEDIVKHLKAMKEAGYLLIVVTNQSGIAREFYTEEDFFKLSKEMEKRFADLGIVFDGWYHCPYKSTSEKNLYSRHSYLRKPLPGMIFKAHEENPVDLERCLIIGDKVSDALHFPNLKSFHIRGNYDLNPVSDRAFDDFDSLFERIASELK